MCLSKKFDLVVLFMFQHITSTNRNAIVIFFLLSILQW